MRLELPGRTLGYDDVGDGDTLLLLHAFPLDRRMWERQLRDLRGTARVVALDFRGLGESDGVGSIDDAADDAAALLDHLGIERATVGGLSMGGYVALAMARRHADRVAGLLLADTKAAADDEAGKRRREELIQQVVRTSPDAFARDFVPRLLTGRNREVTRLACALAGIQPVAGVAGALAALRDRPDQTALLKKLKVPVTVVAGAEDVATPPAELQKLAKAVKGAVYVELPNAGHYANLEAPDGFGRACEELLARVRAVSAPSAKR